MAYTFTGKSASPPQETRASLLLRLGDARDREAWGLFVEVYGPWIHAFLRRAGCQQADADDLTQEVLQAVSGAIGRFRYSPDQGTFRGWLLTITRHKLLRRLGRRRPENSTDPAEFAALQAPDDNELERAWELERQRRLLHWSAERVRGDFKQETWRAFWLTAVEGRDKAEVAEELGMTIGAVYIARSRVLAKLREKVDAVRLDDPEPPFAILP